jgi:sugar phosphate isomerase/epimerase
MTVSRRGFLAGSVATLAGSAVVGSSDTDFSTRVKAANAPVRNGDSHMKLSLAAYSFNRLLSRPARDQKGEMTMPDFVDYCAKLNLDGTELTSYYFPADVTQDYLLSLKEQSFRLGLDISGTAIGNDFCLPEGEKRQAQLQLCRTWIDHAAVMGAPVIRIFAGKVPRGGSEAEALDLCVAGINECLDYAAKKGVLLALENHGGITATPAQLLAIIERVKDSKWFGVNFDSGNFHTDAPYADLDKIAPYAVNAQIKVALKNGGGEKRPADIKRVVEILRSANYRGYVVLEYEEDKPYEEIPMYIDKLREYIG